MKNSLILNNIEIKNDDNLLSLYIHIPFCTKKCNYCAFVSFCASEVEQQKYIDYLIKEIGNFKTEKYVKTIYIGGGTPSLLTIDLLKKVFDTIYANFKVLDNAEITIEVNPNSIDEEKLVEYKKLGINRISVGVQSLKNSSLKKIGRLHDKRCAIDAIKLITKHFDNISADLILGLEKDKNAVRYARKLLKLGVKHISCYMLEIHEKTKLFEDVENKKYQPQDDDDVIKEYYKLVSFLEKHGVAQYEISNFAKDGYESRHNINYWTLGNYFGFGVSAHSFYNGIRRENASVLEDYYAGKYIEDKENNTTIIEEMIMLGLRCFYGINIARLKQLGYEIQENKFYQDFINKWILIEKDGQIYLNRYYFHLSDYIIEKLLP